VPGGRTEADGDQQRPDLVTVQRGGVRLIIQPGPADVRGGGMLQQVLPYGVSIEP
jgi:hypothetical protein